MITVDDAEVVLNIIGGGEAARVDKTVIEVEKLHVVRRLAME